MLVVIIMFGIVFFVYIFYLLNFDLWDRSFVGYIYIFFFYLCLVVLGI